MASYSQGRQSEDFRIDARRSSTDKKMAEEKAFSTIVARSVHEAIEGALGRDVAQFLTSKGLLDNSNNAQEFDKQLRSVFGNGAAVLERLAVKELYRNLNIPYHSENWFDYNESLEVAREASYLEARRN